jgi:Skp family chaperone for outer membrane proteins
MKSSIRRGLTIVSLCLTGAVLAAFATGQNGSKAPPPPSSVAIVDLAQLTLNLDESKLLKDQLLKQRDESQKKLQEIKDELTAVTKNLEAMGKDKKGTPEFLREFARQYELESTLKARGEGLQKLIDVAEGENMKVMFAKVVDAVNRLGKERGYDLILWDDRSIGPPAKLATGAEVWSLIRDRRILYASDRVNITNDVLLQMNNEFKAAKK